MNFYLSGNLKIIQSSLKLFETVPSATRIICENNSGSLQRGSALATGKHIEISKTRQRATLYSCNLAHIASTVQGNDTIIQETLVID